MKSGALITQWGFPCCVRFPCVHAAATTPVQRLGVVFARLTQPCQPSPVPRPDRPAHRPFRGLLSVHSRCGLHTRTVTVCRDRYPKASDTSSPPCLLRLLPAGANRRVGLAPTGKAPPCHGARGKRTISLNRGAVGRSAHGREEGHPDRCRITAIIPTDSATDHCLR